MNARGLIIAAAHSGAGKTTVTLALLAALRRRGVVVHAAKTGPDYIDPAFHAAVTRTPSVNLDTWAMSRGLIAHRVLRHGAELAVVEGDDILRAIHKDRRDRSGGMLRMPLMGFGIAHHLQIAVIGAHQHCAADFLERGFKSREATIDRLRGLHRRLLGYIRPVGFLHFV